MTSYAARLRLERQASREASVLDRVPADWEPIPGDITGYSIHDGRVLNRFVLDLERRRMIEIQGQQWRRGDRQIMPGERKLRAMR